MPGIGKGVEEIRISEPSGANREKTIWTTVGRQDMKKPESYESVWDTIADTPEQAANLRAQAELMKKIAA